MTFDFVKMHGLGNDYIYLDLFAQELDTDWPALARTVSDRHFGVGGDGLILICPGEAARVRMRIFNADGSEAQMCGNGLRCTAKYAYEHGLLGEACSPSREFARPLQELAGMGGRWRTATIETGAGVLTAALRVDGEDRVESVCVDMGPAILEPARIPARLPGDRIIRRPIEVQGTRVEMTCVSMGNPHAVIFCDQPDALVDRLGPGLERHEVFPERANIHFARAADRGRVRVATWERGSGRTLACGTGACAVCVAGVLEGRLDRAVTAELPGGSLRLLWDEPTSHVFMLGPATEVFRGRWLGAGPDESSSRTQ